MDQAMSEKAARFRQSVASLLESAPTGPETLDGITRAYEADMASAEARAAGLARDAHQAMGQRQIADEMLASVHKVATAEILRNARLEAYAAQLIGIVDRVRALAVRARRDAGEGDIATAAIPVGDLDAVLARPLDRAEFTPTVVAVVPSKDYSHGTFESDDGAVTAVWPFIGWSVVVRQGTPEPRRLEPTFLVEDRGLPESFIHDVYAMRRVRLH